MKYSEYEVELAPPWLRGLWGERWHQAMGLVKDALAEGALQAVKARFLRGSPSDSLSYAGTDRQIERAPGESDDNYRARLQKAFTTWRLAGTNKGIIEALKVIGFPSVTIFENKDWAASPDPTAWWLFWVMLLSPLPFDGPWKLGDGTKLGEKPLGFGSAKDAALLELIRRVIRKWKAAHTILGKGIAVFDGKVLGSGWKLGDGTKLGGKAAFFSI